MTAEHKGREFMILASKVNRVCDITSPDEVTQEILTDAQDVINGLANLPPSVLPFEFSFRTPPNQFGGLASTDAGTLMTQANSRGGKKDIKLTHPIEERIGLYKVIKVPDEENYALDFSYFMEEIDHSQGSITVGALSHILYGKKDGLLNGIYLSIPKLRISAGRFKVGNYVSERLWGQAKMTHFDQTFIFW